MSERALAHIEKIAWIKPIEGADNIELIGVLGWVCIAKKGEFKVGDECVYFEIDSKLPEAPWSEFMRAKHFKVKIMKLGKFKIISQGLALPFDAFEWWETIGIDVDRLNNDLKTELQKLEIGTDFIKKTDEERIENCPWYLESKEPWLESEKIDGTSSTYAIDYKKKKKGEFIVCSRNVRQRTEDQTCYHQCGNVYWEMEDKYQIESALRDIAKKNNVLRVVLQGETYGESIQGNPYKLKERRFAAFNLVFDGKRLGSLEARDILSEYNIPFVPITNEIFYLPEDMETFKLRADGKSQIADVAREGFVYRSIDGTKSFKNVSREFLLKHNS